VVQCVVKCCSVLQCVAKHAFVSPSTGERHCYQRLIQSVVQCFAVCCIGLQSILSCSPLPESIIVIDDGYRVCCCMLQCVAKHAVVSIFRRRALMLYTMNTVCVAVFGSTLQRIAACCAACSFCLWRALLLYTTDRECAVVCYCVLQCVATCCSVLQRVAACSVLRPRASLVLTTRRQ